jgi:NAD dependent epimerase/dehydratase family enzyme
MAEVILGSQRVIPQAARSAGFQFEYPELRPALVRLLSE